MKILFILSFLLIVACNKDNNILDPKVMTKISSSIVYKDLMNKLDSLRNINQLAEIENIEYINDLCYYHSLYMLQMGKISHDNFEEDRLSVIKDSTRVHFAFENVGFYRGTENPAEKIFADWMKDSDIKSQLIKNWDKMGMSVVTDSLGNYYTTQIFITLP